MIKLFSTAVGCWLTAASVMAAVLERPGLPTLELGVEPPPSATNLWFDVGEVLRYGVYWGIFGVGYTEARTDWVRHEDGRTLLRVRFETESNSIIEKIWPIKDVQESVIDPETFLPVYFYKNSRQGRHTYNELVTFDHANTNAVWENFRKNKVENVPIDPDTRDIITLMYFLRDRTQAAGEVRGYRVYTDEKLYDLQVEAIREERVKLDRYGKVSCMKMEPKAAFNGLFVRKGRIFLWTSRDSRNICTRIEATLPVASVHLKLLDVEGPGDDFWVMAVGEDKKPSSGRSWRK